MNPFHKTTRFLIQSFISSRTPTDLMSSGDTPGKSEHTKKKKHSKKRAAEEEDKKPHSKTVSIKKEKKESGGVGRVITLKNTEGGPGLCRVVIRDGSTTNESTSEILKQLESSASFLALNDLGSNGNPVTVTLDTLSMLDAAFYTVTDRLLLDVFLIHYHLEKHGLRLDQGSAGGTIVHPEEKAARQSKKVSKKGEILIKPRTIALAIQSDETLRQLFGDIKIPGDTRPPMLYRRTNPSVPENIDAYKRILTDYEVNVKF